MSSQIFVLQNDHNLVEMSEAEYFLMLFPCELQGPLNSVGRGATILLVGDCFTGSWDK